MSQTTITAADIVKNLPASITIDELTKYISAAKKLIILGQGIAAMTPTDVDDKLLAEAAKIVDVIEQHINDPLLLPLINEGLALLKGGKTPKDVLNDILQALTSKS